MSTPLNIYDDNEAYITIVTSSNGSVNKTFSFKDGIINSHANATIFQGFAETVRVNSIENLAGIIANLSSNQAISLGRLPNPNQKYQLTTRSKMQGGAISRTQEYFKHSAKQGYLLIDIDIKSVPQEIHEKISGQRIVDILYDVVPEIRQTSRLVRPSSSAGIIKPDGSESGATGMHIYVKVADQRQSQRILQLIHDRCWEAGYGFFTLARNGNLLERSLVDTSVHGPERLVFEAKPNVLPPLIKRHIPDEVFCDGVLDSIREPNHEKVHYLKDEARNQIKPEAQKAKRQHYEDKTVEVMTVTGFSRNKASQIVRKRHEGRVLTEHDILEISRDKFVKVSDFLDNASGSVGLPCPIEGSDYGLSTAYFYPSDAYRPYPRIISFAHGGYTEFTFERYKHLKGLVWLPKTLKEWEH
jgi:hypothetical protein